MQIPGYKTLEEIERNFNIKLSEDEKNKLKKILDIHPMFIPTYYAKLINWQDPNDPIKKIIFPSVYELSEEGEYDTSGESENTVLTGLQHKYKETALVLATNRCAGYCRHCFRKRLVGIPTQETIKIFDEAVKYVKEHKEITNVLISGGDPLVLPTEVLEDFISKLSEIPHLRFIRIGTRVPVFYPMRIYEDKKLLNMLEKYSTSKKRIYFVTHFNHPKEITQESKKAIDALLDSKVITSNQTVLLHGVNDDPEVLAELMKLLVQIGVVPYYVFQCRPVKRVKSYFQVPLKKGYEIVEGAKKNLDGHSKRFKYIMSHKTGKIEIVGLDKEKDIIYLKYHQAKDENNIGKFFAKKLTPQAGWLDDLEDL